MDTLRALVAVSALAADGMTRPFEYVLIREVDVPTWRANSAAVTPECSMAPLSGSPAGRLPLLREKFLHGVDLHFLPSDHCAREGYHLGIATRALHLLGHADSALVVSDHQLQPQGIER